MAIRGIRQTRRALDAELPGSRPGWPATPPRTACGSPFVRGTARFDPGWRLAPTSPTRIGVRIPLVWGCCPGRHRGQAPCRCGAAVSASPCQGGGREFESRHLLARRDRRYEAGQPIACRPSPIGRGAGLRNLAIGVRVPGTVLRESEPIRDRASLLTTARLTPWCSSHPLSSEDEPARRLAPAGNRAAGNTVGFEFSVLCHRIAAAAAACQVHWPRPSRS